MKFRTRLDKLVVCCILFISILFIVFLTLAEVNYVPVGWLHTYATKSQIRFNSSDNDWRQVIELVTNGNNEIVPTNYFYHEKNIFTGSNATMLLKNVCPDDSFYSVFLKDTDIGFSSEIYYDSLFIADSLAGNDATWYKEYPCWLYKTIMHNGRISQDQTSFDTYFLPYFEKAYEQITKAHASRKNFSGYFAGEEVAIESDNFPNNWDDPVIWDNMQSVIDAADEKRGTASDAPIICGNGVENLMDDWGRHDKAYGWFDPYWGTEFFYEVSGWDVFYTWHFLFNDHDDFPDFYNSDLLYYTPSPPDICNRYQFKMHEFMYVLRWVSDQVRQYNNRNSSNAEWWIALQSCRKYDTNNNILKGRRMTPEEYFALANLAIATGAKGIFIYTLAGAEYGDNVEHAALSYKTLSEALTVTPPALPDTNDYRAEFTQTNKDIIYEYSWEDRDESDNRLYQPYKTGTDMLAGIKPYLTVMRNLTWVTTANAHTQRLSSTLNADAIYELHNNDTCYTYIGDTEDFFTLESVLGDDETTCEKGNWNGNFPFYYNSNITIGLFTWPERDTNGQYYYVVNTRCNKQSTLDDTLVTIADEEVIQLRFSIPYEGQTETWVLSDPINGDSYGTFVVYQGSGTHTSDNITIEAGRSILLELTKQPTSKSGTVFTDQTWSGVINLTGDFAISGADLTISAGTTIIVEDDQDIGIAALNGGTITAEGNSSNRIRFMPRSGKNDRDLWEGIYILGGAGANTSNFEFCSIEGAEKGIRFIGDQGDGDMLNVDYCLIQNCGDGIYLSNIDDAVVHIRNGSIIRNCDAGIIDDYSEGTNSYRDITIKNIDGVGIEVTNGYRAIISGCLIQNCGEQGILMSNVDNGWILESYTDNDKKTTVRYCGQNSDAIYHGIKIDDTYLYRYRGVFVYENHHQGVYATNQSSINSAFTANNRNVYANNALSDDGVTEGTNAQLYVESSSTWNINSKQNTFFNSYPDDVYHISYHCTPDYSVAGNYWWADADNPGTLSTDEFHKSAGAGDFTGLNTVTDTSEYKTGHYWQIQEFDGDSLAALLDAAYTYLDTLNQPAYALEILEDLAEDQYVPALKGICVARKMLGQNLNSIHSAYDDLIDEENDSHFNREIEFAKATASQKFKDFDEAHSIYDDIVVANDCFIPDSLRALIGKEETKRFELRDTEFNKIKNMRWTASAGNVDREIAIVEERIVELEKELYSYYSGDYVRRVVPIPDEFELSSGYPNPFNPTINIPYALPKQADVRIAIYNILGQKVATLIDRKVHAGYHQVLWDGKSLTGVPVSSGMYFVNMEAPGFVKTRKIVMIK